MSEVVEQRGVHLHVHTYHSELDGAGPVEEMVKRAKEMGFKALAITDHGLCSGIPDFIEACYKEGIKPIPGCEIYMTKDMSFESSVPLTDEYSSKLYFKSKKKFNEMVRYIRKEARYQYKLPEYIDTVREYLQHAMMAIGSEEAAFTILDEFLMKEFDSNNFHMVVMAKNNEGLSDLYQMNSHAHLHGVYKKPRVDLAYIKREGLGKNLIATTACIGSYFSQLILAGRYDDAKAHILECNEIFGHFYLEKQATTSLREQAIVNHWCNRMSQETGIPTILTNDVHYINKEDNKYHDIVVCCGTKGPGNKKRTINDPDRLQYDHEYWLKSTDEMMDAVPDMASWERTLEIAELVNVSPMSDIKPQFPLYIMTEEEAASHDTVEGLLRAEAWKGLFRVMTKYSFSTKQDYRKKYNQYAKQLEYELGVITTSGFADYFLIMKDAIQATNAAGYYTAPGRGSAAGSLVCWALGITDLDPVKEKLIFERFLNPERIGYPDY